jgi:hypothetical protein
MKLEFFKRDFLKIHIKFNESHAVRAELFNADTWIDRQP